MQKLADTRPVAIGSMGAGASGIEADADPDAPASPQQGEGGRGGGRGGRGGGRAGRDPNSFGFAVWQIKNGEDKIIADRLAEIFSQAPNASGSPDCIIRPTVPSRVPRGRAEAPCGRRASVASNSFAANDRWSSAARNPARQNGYAVRRHQRALVLDGYRGNLHSRPIDQRRSLYGGRESV